MSTARFLAKMRLAELIEDQLFCDLFCLNCPAVPRSLDEECPAGWCINDAKCYRASKWSNFCEEVTSCYESVLKG